MDKRTFDLLLSKGEGFHLEYKEGVSKDLSSEMVAFANSRGGKILIGVTGNGKVKGISDKNKVKSQIQDTAQNCEPSIPVILSEYKDVIITTIHEGKDKPYQCKSGFYTRIGPSSQKLKRVINIRYELPYGELRRKDIPEIPYDALREAVINAVTHRDYTNRGPCTTIEVFDDRVEISNPGGLPDPLKPEEFGKKSVPRNQVIAEMMLRLKYIEKMGTGIKRMQDLCQETGNPEPEFEFGGFFTVIFKKVITPEIPQESYYKVEEKSWEETNQSKLDDRLGKKLGNRLGKKLGNRLGKKLGENRKKIIKLISGNPHISINVMAEKVGISQTAIEKNLGYLQEKGYIKRVGPKKGGHWEVMK